MCSFMLERLSSTFNDSLIPNVVRWLGADDGQIPSSDAVGDSSLRGSKFFIPDTDLLTGFPSDCSEDCAVTGSRVNIMVRDCMRRREM